MAIQKADDLNFSSGGYIQKSADILVDWPISVQNGGYSSFEFSYRSRNTVERDFWGRNKQMFCK